MKTLLVWAAASTLLALACPGNAFAQRAMRGNYGGRYNSQTVETVSGEVISVDKVTYGRRGYSGVHLLLKTDKGEISVHLGPSWFVDRQSMKVAPHERVEVTGSRVIYGGKPALIAAQVKKGNESLQLRTKEGLPLWRRSRAR